MVRYAGRFQSFAFAILCLCAQTVPMYPGKKRRKNKNTAHAPTHKTYFLDNNQVRLTAGSTPAIPVIISCCTIPKKLVIPETLKQHAPDITEAVEKFKKTPGFASLLKHLLTNHRENRHVQGALWHIRYALSLAASGEKINAFNCIRSSHISNTRREFDIISTGMDGTQYWTECKSLVWNRYKPDESKIAGQITDQCKLVEEYRAHVQHPVAFRVSSEKPLNHGWRGFIHSLDVTLHEKTTRGKKGKRAQLTAASQMHPAALMP